MCTDHSISCSCGKQRASLMFRDDIMPDRVITAIYCPECAGGVAFEPDSMIADNGWIIEYEMAVAEYYASKAEGDVVVMTPEILFDQSYATWLGVYPGDHIDSAQERAELTAMARIDMRRYLEEFRNWGTQRMERLRAEGWRKAQA